MSDTKKRRGYVDKDLVTVVIDAKAISERHPRLPAGLVRGIAVEFGEEASAILAVHFWEKWQQRVEVDFRITGAAE